MIVVTLIALLAGISYPSVTAGLDSIRLRSASDSIVALLNTAVDRAGRSQQVVELMISSRANLIAVRSADQKFERTLEIPPNVKILSIQPLLAGAPAFPDMRRFLIYPGGATPRIGIEIANEKVSRMIRIDPLTGFPKSEIQTQAENR